MFGQAACCTTSIISSIYMYTCTSLLKLSHRIRKHLRHLRAIYEHFLDNIIFLQHLLIMQLSYIFVDVNKKKFLRTNEMLISNIMFMTYCVVSTYLKSFLTWFCYLYWSVFLFFCWCHYTRLKISYIAYFLEHIMHFSGILLILF